MTKLYIDNTTLTATNTCDMKAGLRYVLGYTTADERMELSAGSAVHESLAVWHRGEGSTNALIRFDAEYKAVGSKLHAEERLSFYNVRRVLSRFYNYFTQNPMPYTPQKDLVEVTFEAPLDEHGDVMVMGRIDLMAVYQGRMVVFENKTTGSLNDWWKKKWPMHTQPTTYVYGAKYGTVGGKLLNLPVEECLILGIELRKLPNSDTKCKDHKLPYRECGDFHAKWEFSGPHPRPEGFLQRWRRDALSAAKRFAWMKENIHSIQDCADKLEQQGQFNGACSFCEFHDSCRQGLPVNVMEANLIHQPWDPRDVTHKGLIMPLPVSPVAPPDAVVPLPSRGVLVGAAPLPSNARRV